MAPFDTVLISNTVSRVAGLAVVGLARFLVRGLRALL